MAGRIIPGIWPVLLAEAVEVRPPLLPLAALLLDWGVIMVAVFVCPCISVAGSGQEAETAESWHSGAVKELERQNATLVAAESEITPS